MIIFEFLTARIWLQPQTAVNQSVMGPSDVITIIVGSLVTKLYASETYFLTNACICSLVIQNLYFRCLHCILFNVVLCVCVRAHVRVCVCDHARALRRYNNFNCTVRWICKKLGPAVDEDVGFVVWNVQKICLIHCCIYCCSMFHGRGTRNVLTF
jgi:hypothetical protein